MDEMAPYRFVDIVVEPAEQRITRGGDPLEIEPKALAVLLVLLARPESLVTKAELLDSVWPDSHVTENSLSRAVAQLRRRLGDDPKSPRFIETVPTHGYRFLMPVARGNESLVEAVDCQPAGDARVVTPPMSLREEPEPVDARSRVMPVLGLVLVAAIVTLAILLLRFNAADDLRSDSLEAVAPGAGVPSAVDVSTDRPLDPLRIAVLPIADLDTGDQYLAAGMTEHLVSLLARIEGLRVLPRTSTAGYGDSTQRARAIGQELGAGSLLEGSIERDGESLRTTVRLIDTQRDEVIWSERLDRTTDDFFAIQRHVAARVAESLRLPLASLPDLGAAPTPSFSAYDLYLQGRERYRRQTRADNESAIASFELAQARDPDFAHAAAGLANALAMRTVRYGFESSMLERAEAQAQRALDLDPTLAIAHKALGLVRDSRYRYEGALDAYQKALALDPHYPEAAYNAASVAWELGRWQATIALQRRDVTRPGGRGALAIYLAESGFETEAAALTNAVLEAAPLTGYLNRYLAARDVLAGRFDAAEGRLVRLLAAEPTWARAWLTRGDLASAQGDLEAASAHFERAANLLAEPDPELDLRRAAIARSRGAEDRARTLLEGVMTAATSALESGSEWHTHHYLRAAVHALEGDGDAAIDAYAAAIVAGRRALHWDRADSALALLIDDPRFQNLLSRAEAMAEHERIAIRADLDRDPLLPN